MKEYLTTLVLLAGIVACLPAQSLSPTIIASEGGTATAGSLSLEWTLGELATESVITKHSMHTEGFHQPVLEIEVLENTPEPALPGAVDGSKIAQEIHVYPNPVSANLTIDIEGPLDSEIQLQMFDAYGRLLISKNTNTVARLLQINMQPYVNGLYLLHFQNSAGEIIATYKVVKMQE